MDIDRQTVRYILGLGSGGQKVVAGQSGSEATSQESPGQTQELYIWGFTLRTDL